MDAAEDFAGFGYLLAPIQGYLDRLRAGAVRRPITYRSASAPEYGNQVCDANGGPFKALRAKGWRLFHLPARQASVDLAGLNWCDGGWAVLAPGEEAAPPICFPCWADAMAWVRSMDRALYAGGSTAAA